MDFTRHIQSHHAVRRSAWLLATAFAIVLGTAPALAQDYGPARDDPGYYHGETVIVVAPRYRERTPRGGDIIHASLSKEVRADDLDLRTSWGAYELRSRVRTTARLLCENLERRYPVATDDSPPCYQLAVARAMDQADAAVAEARGYADTR